MPSISIKPYTEQNYDPFAEIDRMVAVLPDERGITSMLITRARALEVRQADRFLDDLISPPSVAPQQGVMPAPQQPAGETKAKPADGSMAWRVTKDLARGAVDAPRQILGGMRDAAQSAIQLGDWVADKAEELVPLGGVQIFDDNWKLAPGYIPPGDPRLAPDRTGAKLPEVREATSVTSGVARAASQFLTGFLAAGPAAGATGLAAGTFSRAAVQGALADFAAFEPHQHRLANLIETVPALKNPVSDYLAARPDDGEIEGRLKNAVEGLGLGALTEGVFRGIRYVRDAKRAADAVDPDKAAARAAGERGAQPLNLLGDESRGLLEQGPPAGAAESAVRSGGNAVTTPAAAAKAFPRTPQGREKAIGANPDFGVPDDVVAKSLTRDGLTPLSDGPNGVYVNFARIDTADDVKKIIDATAQAFKADIDTARRGVRTNAETIRAAGGEDAWNILMERRQGAALNAEQLLAVRNLWEASAAKLFDVAEAAARTRTPEDLFQLHKMLAIHRTIQNEAIAARTETARALQSLRIPAGGGNVERLRSIENVLAAQGGPEAASLMAERIAALRNLPDGAAMVGDFVEKTAGAKTINAIKEIWINTILSNPKTHVVNMLGNFATVAQGFVERAAAARWSQAIGSGEVQIGEAAAAAFGMRQGIRDGMRMFGRALKTGESQFGAMTSKTADVGFDRAISAKAFGIPEGNWLAKAVDGLGAFVNTSTRFLTAEDDFFKSIGYRMELNAQAFREASREVSDGIIDKAVMNARIADLVANPPEHIRLAATDAALYATFTNKPGAVVGAINSLDRRMMAGEHMGGQIGSLALRMLIPFRNTPANLVSYMFERTPLAPLMARYREAVAQGGAAADIARTRLALGSFTMLGVMDLALDGVITGGGPRDPKDRGERTTKERTGWQPYSIKVDDRYFSYKRTDPIGMTLGIAADIAEIVNNATLDEDKQDEVFELVAAATASFANQILDKTYLSGLSEFVDVVHNPNKAPGFIEKRLAAFEPAIVGEMRRQTDPYLRYTHDLVSEFKNRTPGLSKSLPVARDMWGRPRTYQSGLGAVYDALSPIASRRESPEPIDRAALEHDFNLTMPHWSLAYGQGVSVSVKNMPEAYSRFLELRGQVKPSEMGDTKEAQALIRKYGDAPMIAVLNEIVEGRHRLSADYEKADSGRGEGKSDVVRRVISDYGKAARLRLLDELPQLKTAVDRQRGD